MLFDVTCLCLLLLRDILFARDEKRNTIFLIRDFCAFPVVRRNGGFCMKRIKIGFTICLMLMLVAIFGGSVAKAGNDLTVSSNKQLKAFR